MKAYVLCFQKLKTLWQNMLNIVFLISFITNNTSFLKYMPCLKQQYNWMYYILGFLHNIIEWLLYIKRILRVHNYLICLLFSFVFCRNKSKKTNVDYLYKFICPFFFCWDLLVSCHKTGHLLFALRTDNIEWDNLSL